jgi:hypothetical protein
VSPHESKYGESGDSVRQEATWFACSNSTPVEELLKRAAIAVDAALVADLGGICLEL